MQVVPYVQPRPRGVKGVSATVSIENAESTPVYEVILRQHSDEVMTEQVCVPVQSTGWVKESSVP